MPNQSIEELNRIIENDPKNAHAHLSRGRLYVWEEKYRLALDDFIFIDANYPHLFYEIFNIDNEPIEIIRCGIESFLLMSELYRRCPSVRTKENFQIALSDLNAAINLKPNNSDIYLARAKLFICNHQYHLAEPDLTKAIEIDPNNAEAYLVRSKLYKPTNFELALQDVTKGIELNPRDSMAYIQRSKLFESKINYEKAIHDAGSAISINPNNVELLLFRAGLYEKNGQFKIAVKDALFAAELEPENRESYFLSARLYGQLEKYDQAIENITKAIEILETNASIDIIERMWDETEAYYNFRGNLYERIGKEELAIKDYQYALRFAPDNEGYRYLSKILAKQGKYSDALDYANKSLSMYDSDDVDILELRGKIYAENGQYEEAYKDLLKALKFNKESVEKTVNYITDCIIHLQNRKFDLPIRSSKNMLFEDGTPIVLNKKITEPFRTIIELYIENHKDTILLRENKKYLDILKSHFDNEINMLFWNLLKMKDKNDDIQIGHNLGDLRKINEKILYASNPKFSKFKIYNRRFSDYLALLNEEKKIDLLIDRSIFSLHKIPSEYGVHPKKEESILSKKIGSDYAANPEKKGIVSKPTINTVNSLLFALKDVILWFDNL